MAIARWFNMQPNAVHNAMRRGSLRYIKVGRLRKTTKAWFAEYLEDKHKREKLKNRLGMRIFDKEKGLYTIAQAAKYLRTCKQLIYNYQRDGYITLGSYNNNYVVTKQQLMQIQLIREEIRKTTSMNRRKK